MGGAPPPGLFSGTTTDLLEDLVFTTAHSATELERSARIRAATSAAKAEVSRLADRFFANSCIYSTAGDLLGGATVVDVRRTTMECGRVRQWLNRPSRHVTRSVTALVDADGHVSFVRPHGGPDVAAMRRLGAG